MRWHRMEFAPQSHIKRRHGGAGKLDCRAQSSDVERQVAYRPRRSRRRLRTAQRWGQGTEGECVVESIMRGVHRRAKEPVAGAAKRRTIGVCTSAVTIAAAAMAVAAPAAA